MKLLLWILLIPIQDEGLLEKLEREISAVVRKVRPSVVSLEIRTSESGRTIQLSGVVYRREGFLLTDAGAVSGAQSIRVTLGDGRTLESKVIGADAKTGVAVLRVGAADLVPATLGRSADLPSGAFTIAVGNSYGLRGSSSPGTLAGIDRSVRVLGRRFDRMLQLTTPAHPGDCGAFVADSRGRLIGLVHSSMGTEEESEEADVLRDWFGHRSPRGGTITFAVPIETIQFVADRIIKHGRMVRGWIGVSARTSDSGVELLRVEFGGPAKRAGLARGDVIVAWGGDPVRDVGALQSKVERVEEACRVKIVVLRESRRSEVDLRVELEPEGK